MAEIKVALLIVVIGLTHSCIVVIGLTNSCIVICASSFVASTKKQLFARSLGEFSITIMLSIAIPTKHYNKK